jgi:hypothetical protein
MAPSNETGNGDSRNEANVMKTIDDVLLAHGGERVLHQDGGLDEFIIEYGGLLSPNKVTLKKGRQHNCHRNTSGFYIMNYPSYRIATGYALSNSLWYPHSWLLAKDTIIETTRAFRLYFGVTLDELQAAKFVMCDVFDISPALADFCQGQADHAE